MEAKRGLNSRVEYNKYVSPNKLSVEYTQSIRTHLQHTDLRYSSRDQSVPNQPRRQGGGALEKTMNNTSERHQPIQCGPSIVPTGDGVARPLCFFLWICGSLLSQGTPPRVEVLLTTDVTCFRFVKPLGNSEFEDHSQLQ